MGVNNLIKLIREYAPDAIEEYPFNRFEGYTVPVEASMMMYSTVIAIRSSGQDLTNDQGQIVSHLQVIMYKILFFLENKMTPIFIFDGKPPPEKEEVLKERRKIKQEAQEEIKNNKDHTSEEYIEKFKKSYSPSQADINEFKIMLDLMGIPYIDAPGEAEALCAWLTNKKDENNKRYVKGVCSDDSDTLVFGAKYLFKDMMRFMKGNRKIQVVSLTRVLKGFDITYDQLIDLAVLLGCDYIRAENEGKGGTIRGVGPVTALDAIRQHKTLKEVLKVYKDVITPEHKNKIIRGREVFVREIKKIDDSMNFILNDDNLKCRLYQKDELTDFMVSKHGFNAMNIRKAINRLDKAYKTMNVTRANTKKVYLLRDNPNNIGFNFVPEESDQESNESDNEDLSETEEDLPKSKNKTKNK
jgi:flap endonuclease-1